MQRPAGDARSQEACTIHNTASRVDTGCRAADEHLVLPDTAATAAHASRMPVSPQAAGAAAAAGAVPGLPAALQERWKGRLSPVFMYDRRQIADAA
jgi:hypothetical protein